MSLETEIRVTIGDIEFDESDVSGLRWHSQLRGMSTAEFTLDRSSEKVRRIAMTDRVEVLTDDRLHFGGHVIEAFADGERLQVKCAAAPQFDSDLVGFVTRASVYQGMRMLVLDAGLSLPDADDDNLVCKASTRALDWDQLLDNAQAAANCGDALRMIGDSTSGADLSKPETDLLQKGLARIRQAVEEAGRAKDDVFGVPASAYRQSIVEWRADAWRYRRNLDDHEVIVPVRDLAVPLSSVVVGDVTFMDASGTSVMTQYLTEDRGMLFRADWDVPVFARTVITAHDLWSAKEVGRERVVHAIERLVFRLNYTLGQWKLADAQYAPVRYSRPSSACPAVADASMVHNLATDEYWLGPAGHGRAPDLVELSVLTGPHSSVHLLC